MYRIWAKWVKDKNLLKPNLRLTIIVKLKGWV